MNDIQSDRFSMFLTVNQFLMDHETALNPVAQIAPLQVALDEHITKITDYAAIQGSDTTGYTEQKSAERMALEQITLKVSRACAAFFLSENQPGKLKLSDFTAAELDRKRDNDLFVDSKWLYTIAKPVENDLTDFNSGPVDVENLQKAFKDFFEVLRLPKTKRDEKTASTQMLEREFVAADGVIDQLDIYMSTFETSEPMLYLEYTNARSIDSTGGGSQNTKSGTLQGNGIANVPFADGKIEDDTELTLYNNSTGPNAGELQFYFSSTTGGTITDPAKTITVQPGSSDAVLVLNMGFSEANPYLNVFNPNAATGKWKVEIV
ncbi:MAG: hypothetical protein IPH78_13725 [Bacteroidetes bacterium]|nr:hypothetical protein [Bacteroidota bacterium]